MPVQISPIRIFATLLALIFCVEIGMMLFLHYVFPEDASIWVEATADAGLLTAILSVFIWRLIVTPLRLAMASEAARAKAIMDTAAEGIVTIDEHGVIESFNHAAEGMFGYDATNVIGQNVKILMPEPHASSHDGYIARYLQTEVAHVIGRPRELSARRKDGSEFPIELNLTEVRVGGKRYFTGILRDVSERKQAEERIRLLAHFDALTGLPNRALFYDRLGQAMGLAKRDRHELALLYLDLDKFKAVNDTLGHDAGDELLKDVAGRIRRQVRESDTVARLGGDEFTVILPKIASRDNAAGVSRKIVGALCAPFQLGDQKQEACIGTSIGIAIYPADTLDPDGLVKAADTAMYEAKQTRNTFRFYTKESESERTNLEPENRLSSRATS